MATEALVSDHTSATDEVEKEENEAITANGEKSVSLSNANEEKHDKVEDTQGPAMTLSETEAKDKKPEAPVVEVEKTDDSPALEASVADNLKEEKEAIPDSQTIIVTEPAPDTVPEKESADTGEEKQPERDNIPQAPAEETIEESSKIKPPQLTIEESSKIKSLQLNPLIESELVKETPQPEVAEAQEISQEQEKESPEKEPEEKLNTVAIPKPPAEAIEKQSETVEEKPRELESDAEVVMPMPMVAQVQEKELPEKEQEEQPNTVVNPEPPAEAIEKQSEIVEEKPREPEPDAEVVKPEPVVAQVQEKESPQKEQEEQENTAVVVPEASAETIKKVSEAVEEKQESDAEVVKETETSETGSQNVEWPQPEGNLKTESEAEGVKETENSDTSSDKVEKPEPVVAQVQEKSKEASEKGEEEQENAVAVVPEGSSETIEKVSDAVEEKPREVVKETEEPEPAVTKIEENPSELQEKFVEKGETVIPEKTAETTEKPLDIIEDHSTKESDIEVVKETSKTDALPVEAEKPQVESEKPREQSQVAQVEVEEKSKDVEEKPREVEQSQAEEESKDVETKQEVVRENESESAKSEGTSDTLVPTSLKEGETIVTNNSEAQVAVVEEDHKKESSCSDVVQDLAKDVVGVSATTKQGTDKKESSVEEEVAANDGNESSREAVVEIHKAGEQNVAKTGTTEGAGDKVESVKHEDGHQGSKVEEVIAAVTEPVRETLASKLQEKEEESKLETQHVEDTVKTQEPFTKENNTIKTSKDLPKETPAKPAQKQSNNIISKVKQSLVKAKKAITGKSPNSKTVSSDTQGDIKVK